VVKDAIWTCFQHKVHLQSFVSLFTFHGFNVCAYSVCCRRGAINDERLHRFHHCSGAPLRNSSSCRSTVNHQALVGCGDQRLRGARRRVVVPPIALYTTFVRLLIHSAAAGATTSSHSPSFYRRHCGRPSDRPRRVLLYEPT